ncbi:hypothetical protein FOA52_011046 [Chlamydomonas sp. UWO 241]|nr:hypothetical protein FOA52_011046 [Chlamydomonas sp. UWO 241]
MHRARAAAVCQPQRVAHRWSRSVVVQNAPKTGQHQVEGSLTREALSLFFERPDSCTATNTSGGVNNVVNYVETPEGKRYVLRIYNNGNKSEKVVFEHAVLSQLALQPMRFDVPRALLSRAGRPHELLSSGAECCVFEIIPGTLAKTTSPEEVGRATGELNMAMGKVKVDMKPPVAPYYDLFNVHSAVKTSDVFYREVETNPGFDACREDIDFLYAQIKAFEARLSEMMTEGLPLQLIHGDLHYDNVMVVGDTVSGLLDFEFCSYDFRTMELAVALSKYVGEAEPLSLCERFVSGYVEKGQLSPGEIDALPDLINLRIFSNTVYFTGRAIAGEDSLDSLTSRAPAYAKRVKWVNANRGASRLRLRSA